MSRDAGAMKGTYIIIAAGTDFKAESVYFLRNLSVSTSLSQIRSRIQKKLIEGSDSCASKFDLVSLCVQDLTHNKFSSGFCFREGIISTDATGPSRNGRHGIFDESVFIPSLARRVLQL